ncbi:nitrile-specifier protein 2 [Echria macrotheca]|uniref:Nitrile-specifier protein 2 n=1 Tax=Echria macrotheca TaxID=438768 RepID=A0AAJ0BDB7_9PEZI|nr:nitrile-specifier protein 2 [Echria macrotheca]
MDSFKLLKRRTTDLFNSLPQNLPSIQSLNLGQHHGHHAHGRGPSMKGTFEKISIPPLPRSSHSANIIAGTVYIFGGESEDARKPVDNDILAVTLPSSGAPADYYTIKPKAAPKAQPPPAVVVESPVDTETDKTAEEAETSSPAVDKGKAPEASPSSSLGDVPGPRVGHASASIGHRIFVFGGRGGPEMDALDERGRVWVFDTRTHLWSYLDPVIPVPATSGSNEPIIPAPRSYHVAVATDKPNEFDLAPRHPKAATRADSWKEWARGDSDEVGIPQRPIVGAVAARATDVDDNGYGTFIIHGGCLSGGARASDVWAFDVHSRTWQRLPDAPGSSRGGAALALSRSRLYRFGGFNGETEEGGQLDVLELTVDQFNDEFSAGEVAVSARGGWQSLLQNKEDVGYKEVDTADAPLTSAEEADPWPGPRSVARMEAVTVGGGREYLVLMMGERSPSGAGHEAAGSFWDDVWVFQVPAHSGTAASLADNLLSAVGRKSAEGKWARVQLAVHDDEDDASLDGPGARGWFASAPMGELEENGIVIWGGLDAGNKRLGDGWIIRLG